MAHDVNVTVGASTSPLETGLNQAKGAVEGFRHHASEQFGALGKEMLGAFAFAAILEGIKSIFDEFGKFQDLSEKFGTSAESLQHIAEVAKGAGIEVESVMKALSKGKKNSAEAVAGNVELAEAFERLGVSAKEFQNLSPEEQLIKLSEEFEKSGDSAEYLNNITKALGKSGQDTFALLRMGPEGLREELEDAAAASNEAIASIDNAGDNLNKVWGRMKVAGAEAINYVIKRVEALGVAMAAAVEFVSNLGDGFAAAKAKAAQALEAAAQLNVEEEKAAEEKAKRRAANEIKASAAEDSKEAKKAAEELGKIQEDNAKKQEEAYMRSLSLLERKAELERKIANENLAAQNQTLTPLEREKAKGKALDLTAERDSVNKEIARDEEKAAQEQGKKMAKLAKEQIKEVLDAKKDELKDAEKSLSTLEKVNRSFNVDSLRAIGGGVAGANYNPNSAKDDLQKQQVDLARQQVERLNTLISTLEKAGTSVMQYDGSFTSE